MENTIELQGALTEALQRLNFLSQEISEDLRLAGHEVTPLPVVKTDSPSQNMREGMKLIDLNMQKMQSQLDSLRSRLLVFFRISPAACSSKMSCSARTTTGRTRQARTPRHRTGTGAKTSKASDGGDCPPPAPLLVILPILSFLAVLLPAFSCITSFRGQLSLRASNTLFENYLTIRGPHLIRLQPISGRNA